MVGQPSMVRAAFLVAFGAVLEATLAPLLAFGWVGPRFAVLAIVVAVTGQQDLQALLLGFFGGVLHDALGSGLGLFGVGTLSGLVAATISLRLAGSKGDLRPMLALSTAAAVAAYDLIGLTARILAGQGGPQILPYFVGGVLPNAVLNAVLAYLVGGWLLNLVKTKGGKQFE